MWPTTARPEPGQLPRVWALVNATSGDPVAPFAMQMLKSYFFSADGTAAIAYRTRLGYAVVSGDPIGDEDRFERADRRIRRDVPHPRLAGGGPRAAVSAGSGCGGIRR